MLYHSYPVTAHTRNVVSQAVPLGQVQLPVHTPALQVPLEHSSPAPAALKQVVVFTGGVIHDVQLAPLDPRSRHVNPFYKYSIMIE
jgi:hypothetical protein